MLGGCGLLLVGVLAGWLWSKHDKTKQITGDSYGIFFLLSILWIIISAIVLFVAIANSV
jgi:uncharacterized membrane protein